LRFTNARRPDPVIDVTPMIDIVFQLVLFFMVSTTFVQTPGIQVDLPRSSSQTVLSDDTDVNIWMTVDGAVFVDDVPMTNGELRSLLAARAKVDPNTMVVLKADTGVHHGRVVLVMDMARAYGLTKIAIATELPERD